MTDQITVTIPKIGSIAIDPPESLAICFEFSALWSGDLDLSQQARLCAGALGVVLDKTARYPKFRPLNDTPMSYGHKMLERLIRDGATPQTIYQEGTKALITMAGSIPTNQEIEEKVNFTTPRDNST